jgi:hypothetical protein
MTLERSGVQESTLCETLLTNGLDAEAERANLAQLETTDEAEDCPFCRALDCDIIFALIFTLVIGCLLVLIMVGQLSLFPNRTAQRQHTQIFWLRGVFQYQGSVSSTYSMSYF